MTAVLALLIPLLENAVNPRPTASSGRVSFGGVGLVIPGDFTNGQLKR